MMKWNHLPVTGGLYSQHPKFLDEMLVIAEHESKARQEEIRRQQAQAKRKSK